MSDGGKVEKPKAPQRENPSHEATSEHQGVGIGGGYHAMIAQRQAEMDKVTYRATGGAEGTPPAGDFAARRRSVVGEAVERIMRKGKGGASVAAQIPTTTGAPLPADVRAKMEPKMNADLGSVRIHTGGESAKAAADFGARAFAVGSDVHFNSGEFQPGTKEGDRLLGHELTHVIQGKNSGVQRKAEPGGEAEQSASEDGAEHEVSQPGEPAEQEADAVGDHVAESLHDDAPKGAAAGKEKKDPSAQKSPAGDIAEKAPPKIAAKLSGIGPKVWRAEAGKPRVNAPVPGLYDSIHGAKSKGVQVGALKFSDTVDESKKDRKVVETTITVDGGKGRGDVGRTLMLSQDGKRSLVLDHAFLDDIPEESKWVSDDGKPLVKGKGIPLQTYTTIRQMKIMGIQYGDLGKADFKKVKMSTIVNERTIFDLAEQAKKQPGMAEFERIKKSHSYQYAETVIIQSGAKIVNAHLEDGVHMTVGDYVKERNKTEREAEMKKRGLLPGDKLHKNFNVVIEVAPFLPSTPVPSSVGDKA